MTREKKEILKKIEAKETGLAADMTMGCGFAPPNAYDDVYREIDSLWDRLARLRGYKDAGEMEHDPRPIARTSPDYGIL
ncbi:MAG: hypothetical protein IJT44_13535 [Clostridia bacterium]|nr:hypothetical protein [Clostridia bacterium]